jgi:PAS domain S-box-containing protein
MIIAFMEEVMQHPGVPKKLLYKTRRKDGSYIWCERVTINLLGDPAIAGIVSNFRDITERIEAERTIKDSEYKFRSLIQNSSDAITIADENGKRVFASDSLKKLTGYTPAEIIGEPIFSMVHPDYRDAAAAFTSRVHASPGVPLKFVYKAIKKDGTPIWCERITTNLLHDPAVSGIISNIRDITDRQEKEEELTLSNEELKTRNEELDKFVYSVSHDLRAPLTSILGLVEISGYCETVEDITGNLDMMKSSVHKLDSFIQDILNYSKNARTEVAKERIDFNDLLNGIADNLRFINAGSSRVRIETRYENGFDFYSDSHRINVILNNLLSNAIKYANPEAADPFVFVSAKLHANYAEVHIEDNGIGIKEEYQGKVFDMFFRATVSAPGSGLGLYIVREMLKKLNGTITFTSVEGKGTKFSLTIPNSAPESSNAPGVQCAVNLAHEAV